MHHSLMNGDYNAFHEASKPITCDSIIVSLKDGPGQIDSLIQSAIYHRKPEYIGIPMDECNVKLDVPMNPLPSAPFYPHITK